MSLKFIKRNMAYYLKDQLSIKSRKMLADYLSELILIADSIDMFRLALAETPQFTGVELFRHLNKSQKGYLIPSDFSCLVLGQSKKLLHYAFSWFDVAKVGEITKNEFLEFIFPKAQSAIRDVITNRMVQQSSQAERKATLPWQIDLLQGLFLEIMTRQIKLIPLRRVLMDQQDYTLKAVMNCLNVQARNWVTTGDFYKFLNNYDIKLSVQKVCTMLGVYDHDMNGKIYIKQLEILIEGLQKSNSKYRQVLKLTDNPKTRQKNNRCSCPKSAHKTIQKNRVYSQKRSKVKGKTAVIPEISNPKIVKDPYISDFNQKENKKKISIQKVSNKQPQSAKKQNINLKQHNQLNKKSNSITPNQLEILRQSFQIKQNEALLIDQDLLRIQKEMNAQTQFDMQVQLQAAMLKKRRKIEQQEFLKQQIKILETKRSEQILWQMKEQQALLRINAQNNRKLEQQITRNQALQRQNYYLRQLENIKIEENIQKRSRIAQQKQQRQRQKLQQRSQQKQRQQQRTNYIALKNIRETQSQRYDNNLTRIHQLEAEEIRNNLVKQRLKQLNKQQEKLKDRQSRRIFQSKINAIHTDKANQKVLLFGKSLKQSEYFWKYHNYCQNLASVADPLGIKQHLLATDKYLVKSKEIREQIKRDRTHSLNRYTVPKYHISERANTQFDELPNETPANKQKTKEISVTGQKGTEKTKLMWSNH